MPDPQASLRAGPLALWASAGGLSACVAFWRATGDQTRAVGPHLAAFGLAALAYLVALRASRGLGPRALRAALGLALLWRLALVPAPPLISDDLYRYVWEGRIQTLGGNPYAWSDRPEAERWQAWHDATWEHVAHKNYTALYPPLWQLLARGVVSVHDSPWAMKLFLVLCEALALLLMAALLARRGLPPERLLVWAWSPLALVEIAGSGHNEPLGLLFLAAALLALESGRPLLAALAAVLAAQAKLVPGLLAAGWLRRFRAWQLLSCALASLALVLPFVEARQGLWRTLVDYGQWRFNETLFALLESALGSAVASRAAALGLLVALAALLSWRRADTALAGLALTAAWLLLGPNVLPWYALWLLPWLVLREAPWALAFTLTSALAYLVYLHWPGGAWQVPWSVRALEYAPCLALGLRALQRPAVRSAP